MLESLFEYRLSVSGEYYLVSLLAFCKHKAKHTDQEQPAHPRVHHQSHAAISLYLSADCLPIPYQLSHLLAMPSTPNKLHPSLKAVSPDSVHGTTSPEERIDEAFGHKLWVPFEGPLPGTTSLWAAHKRLSNRSLPQDHHLSPTELLKFLGVVEIPSTARLFQIVEGAARDKLPGVSTVSLAKKWFAHLAIPAEKLSDFDGLNDENPTMEVRGASVRLLSHDAPSFGGGGGGGGGDEEGEKQGDDKGNSFEDEVEKYLTSGVPRGHRRFFHGTDSVAAHNILTEGIRAIRFANNSDFGPAFCTTENCNLAFMFSIYEAAAGSGRAAVLSFDVPEATYNNLKCWQVNYPEWTNVVSLCHMGDSDKALVGNESIGVVVGDMSHRIGGSSDETPVRPFKGSDESSDDFDIVQHAFRGSSGQILTADMAKVGALLFDIPRARS